MCPKRGAPGGGGGGRRRNVGPGKRRAEKRRGAGEWQAVENFVLSPPLCQEGPKKTGPCHE